MDADDAFATVGASYLRLFRRHLVLMHVVHISATVALWLTLWLMAGTTFTLWVVAIWLFWSVAMALALWLRRQHSSP